MKIVFEKRNSVSPKRNSLVQFEIFDSMLLSLTESTYIEVQEVEGRIVIRNNKYYLTIPADMVEVVKAIVLRRIELTVIDTLKLYALYTKGIIKAGRVEELSSSEDQFRSRIRSRIIEISEVS